MIRPLLLAAALFAPAAVAQAQTASPASPLPTAQGREDEVTTRQQIDAWVHAAPPVNGGSASGAALGGRGGAGPDGPWGDAELAGDEGPSGALLPYDAPPAARTMIDGRVHGEVGAAVSNRGYGGYGVASAPLGRDGYVQLGVSDWQGSGGRRDRYWGGGDRRSVNLSVGWFPHREEGPWRRPDADPRPAADGGS